MEGFYRWEGGKKVISKEEECSRGGCLLGEERDVFSRSLSHLSLVDGEDQLTDSLVLMDRKIS